MGCNKSTLVKDSRQKECQICFSFYTLKDNRGYLPGLKSGVKLSCKHSFCSGCIREFIRVNILDSKSQIICPNVVCSKRIKKEVILRLVDDPSILAKFSQLCIEEMVGTEAMYCPNKKCSAALLLPKSTKSPQASNCLHCSTKICFQCQALWHDGMTCDEFQKDFPSSQSREDRQMYELASRKKWQKCPRCKTFIAKIDGCNHIKCRCRQEFCYQCAKPYLSLTNGADARATCSCNLFNVPRPRAEIVRRTEEQNIQVVYLDENSAIIGLERRFARRRSKRLPGWLLMSLANNQCHYCLRQFSALSDLDAHQRQTQAHAVYACCGRTFRQLRDLNHHRRAVHP